MFVLKLSGIQICIYRVILKINLMTIIRNHQEQRLKPGFQYTIAILICGGRNRILNGYCVGGSGVSSFISHKKVSGTFICKLQF